VQQKAALDAGEARYEQGFAELKAQLPQFADTTTPQEVLDGLDTMIVQVESVRTRHDELVTELSELRKAQELGQEGLEDAIAELEAAIATLEQQLPSQEELKSLHQARAAAQTLVASRSELDAGKDALERGEEELARGKAQLESSRAEAEEELAAAEAQLRSAQEKLRTSRADIETGKEQLDEASQELAAKRQEAEEKFQDADAQIADAQANIDAIGAPDIYVLDRTQSESAATYAADTERIDAIAQVFPLMFFLVAALVALTTMTRMVDSERVLIGTFKALGYTKMRIASRYLIYALAAAGTGALLGTLVLSQLLPEIIMNAYGVTYSVPALAFPLPLDPAIGVMSCALGIGVTLVATWAAISVSLHEVPAALMQPRAPLAGKRIVLERIRPLWRRLSFLWKVSLRNIFRYKRRLFMSVVGIAGTTALLLVGFGLRDAIWDVIACQFGPLTTYDMVVGLSDGADLDALAQEIEAQDPGATMALCARTTMQVKTADEGDTSQEKGSSIRVSIVVAKNCQDMSDMVTLRDRQDGHTLAFSDDSAIVVEKLSELANVTPGSTLSLYEQDSVGNAIGDPHDLVCTDIAENYVDNIVYLGEDAWERMGLGEAQYNTYLVKLSNSDAAEHVRDELEERAGVSSVSLVSESVEAYEHTLSVVNVVVVVLIVSAALLAFIVLYNLTNINVEERIREIATLKVLGFTKAEVFLSLVRETLFIATVGGVLGLFLGTALEGFVVRTAEVDYIMFGRDIYPLSYVVSFVLTLVFSLAVILIMKRKLDAINMVESLKSIE
jgi:putative ABC transport system permease protein